MKRLLRISAAALALAVFAQSANADLIGWQNQVTSSGTATATNFSTVTGATPMATNVGALSGARTFEFIVNSGSGGTSQTLLGDLGNNIQAVRFKLFGTNNYGITNLGGGNFDSGAALTANTDLHLVFASDGTETTVSVNGSQVGTMNTPLSISGTTGLGGLLNTGTNSYSSTLAGEIKGFASYDSELSAADIIANSNAFSAAAVPEPTSLGVLLVAGMGVFRRKRST